jgi:hypothetical protein
LPGAAGQTEGTATAALVLAILSWICAPIVFSAAALVLASIAKKRIDASNWTLGGLGAVNAARIIAIVNIVLVGLLLLLVAALVLLGNSASTRLSVTNS